VPARVARAGTVTGLKLISGILRRSR
jgi:hypothetical protein